MSLRVKVGHLAMLARCPVCPKAVDSDLINVRIGSAISGYGCIRLTGNMEHLSGITVLIRFDADGLHHLAPLLGFLGDQLAEVSGRTRKHRAAEVIEPRFHVGIGEASVDLLV